MKTSDKQIRLHRYSQILFTLSLLLIPLGYAAYQQWLPAPLSNDPDGYPVMALLFAIMGGFARFSRPKNRF